MPLNVRTLLKPELLLESYVQAGQEEVTPLTDRFFTNPKDTDGDEASVIYHADERRPAPMNRRGVSARVLELTGATQRKGAMFHSFNQLVLSDAVLRGIKDSDNPELARMASEELAMHLANFARRHRIQKELALAKTLAVGTVYRDGDGLIREGSGTGIQGFTFGIDASHQGNLGGIITAWSTESASIWTQFENIDAEAMESNVPIPDLVICNSTAKPKIRANNEFEALVAASPTIATQMASGQMVENLFGKTWLFLDHTYKSYDGTYKKYIPDGKAVLVPSTNNGWLRPMQGKTHVPTRLDVARSLDEMINSLQPVYGQFAYASVNHNPVQVELFTGDTYGWVLAEPNAIWQADIFTP